jgi:hypothetical protein
VNELIKISRIDKFYVIVVFVYVFILWTDPVSSLFKINVMYLVILQFLFVVPYIIISNRKYNYRILPLVAFLFIGSIITSLFWVDLKMVFLVVPFIISLLMLLSLNYNQINVFINWSSSFLIVLIIGAWIGFIYALFGGQPLFYIERPNGLFVYYFLTTFSNSWNLLQNTIRPTGIYDEPGAFSFVICTVAFMRHNLNKGKNVTWIILLSGFITLSLAHLVYVFFHFLAERMSLKNTISARNIFITSVSILLISIINVDIFRQSGNVIGMYYTNRLEISQDNTKIIEGDNRFYGFILTAKALSVESILFGLDNECAMSARACSQNLNVGLENPLGPIARAGLLNTWPYYLLILLSFVLVVNRRSNLVFLGFALILLQRPYTMAFGYSLLIILPYMTYFLKKH